jgi:hypothetical protein
MTHSQYFPMTGSIECPPVYSCNFGIATELELPGSTPVLVMVLDNQVIRWTEVYELRLGLNQGILTIRLTRLGTRSEWSLRLGQSLGHNSSDEDSNRLPKLSSLSVMSFFSGGLIGISSLCQSCL